MSYCKGCGALKTSQKTGRFDAGTGEMMLKEVCSNSPCLHGYGSHSWDEYKSGWFFVYERCIRCGAERKYMHDSSGF